VSSLSVALLTGGTDKPYALGLASAISEAGVAVDFIGSDELDCTAVHEIANLRFLNLRGEQRNASVLRKATRVVAYYVRLLHYVATTTCPTLHILWNSRFEWFDRTVMMACYRVFGRKVVLTAHNVNAAARDGRDSAWNRFTLAIQYRLCDHVFVHTEAMKSELIAAFRLPAQRVTVIPFGINETIPTTTMSREDARQLLGLGKSDRAVLFFGQIAAYKGLEYLVEAIGLLAEQGDPVRLIVGGKIKRGYEDYWQRIEEDIARRGIEHLVVRHVGFIPDDQVERFLKAADAVILPYVDIFQSGVPFLAFSFGLPVIATDVGSLRDDVTHETGVLCQPKSGPDLARAIQTFFRSPLYQDAANAGGRIRALAAENHSWQTVAERTAGVYAGLTHTHSASVDQASTNTTTP
jgi:D-inositol-3-phosphate glycosyltransferase